MIEACENAKADNCMTLADTFTHPNFIVRKPRILAVTVTQTCIFQCSRGRLTASNDHNLFNPRGSGKLGVWGQISDKIKKKKKM